MTGRNLHCYRLVLPTPFRVGTVNAYLILNRPLTLIDTGPHSEETWCALGDSLRAKGLDYADIERILITHAHPDHCGLAQRLQEVSGAPVFVHPLEDDKVRQGLILPFCREWLVACGVPPQLSDEVQTATRRLHTFIRPIGATTRIDDGARLAGDGYHLLTLHTPGHSTGHLCFYAPDQRLLWCGDTLLEHITPNPLIEPCGAGPFGRTRSLAQFVASINRLNLIDVKEALPGHGRLIENHRQRLQEMLDHHRRRALQILAFLRQAGKPLTPWQLAGLLYADLTGEDVFLAVSEVIAHLDVLESRGMVEQSRRNDRLFYRISASGSEGRPEPPWGGINGETAGIKEPELRQEKD